MRIENVQILMDDGVFRSGSVEFGETIQSVEADPGQPDAGGGCIAPGAGAAGASGAGDRDADAYGGCYLIPGLIDIHTHGALGGDHNDGSPDKLRVMARFYAGNGVTSFLATTLTADEQTLSGAMSNVAGYTRPPDGARCLGINMEGPFFSYAKRGAHPAHLLRLPDIAMFERLNNLSGGAIRLVCVAPELDGAMEFIREASKAAHVSLAHSEADYDTAMRAFDSGATHATHLFNGMGPFSHREPGIIGAALCADAFVEAICDGNHLHSSVILAIYRMFPQRVCMISDSLRCAGMPDGNYVSAGLPVIVSGGKALLVDGGALAGSTISLMQGVRIAVSLGIPLADAVTAATKHSAQALGMEKSVGSLIPGAYADLVLLDSELNIQKVYINGTEIRT